MRFPEERPKLRKGKAKSHSECAICSVVLRVKVLVACCNSCM